mgnify:CR=1 FL=1
MSRSTKSQLQTLCPVRADFVHMFARPALSGASVLLVSFIAWVLVAPALRFAESSKPESAWIALAGAGLALLGVALSIALVLLMQALFEAARGRSNVVRILHRALGRELAIVTGARLGCGGLFTSGAYERLKSGDGCVAISPRAKDALGALGEGELPSGEEERVRAFLFRSWSLPALMLLVFAVWHLVEALQDDLWGSGGVWSVAVLVLTTALLWANTPWLPVTAEIFMDPRGARARVLFRSLRFDAGRDLLILDRAWHDANAAMRVTLISRSGGAVRILTHVKDASRLVSIWRSALSQPTAAPPA